MTKIKIYKLGGDEWGVHVRGARHSVVADRYTQVTGKEAAKAAAVTLLGEWNAARRQKRQAELETPAQ